MTLTSIRIKSRVDAARRQFNTGDYDRADIVVAQLLELEDLPDHERLDALVLKSCVLSERCNYAESVSVLEYAGVFVDEAPANLKARFFAQRAHVNVKLKKVDSALVDYEEARFWAQESGEVKTEASIRNNLAKRYSEAGRLDEAIAESDAAISVMKRLGEDVWLGRFYDQRAQILFDYKLYAESVIFGEKAVALLGDHPASHEAQTTYGKALIALGSEYLEHSDPVERFRASRSISFPLDKKTLELALERSKGHVSQAAEMLDLHHAAILKSIKKFGLCDLQQRRHAKSIIRK